MAFHVDLDEAAVVHLEIHQAAGSRPRSRWRSSARRSVSRSIVASSVTAMSLAVYRHASGWRGPACDESATLITSTLRAATARVNAATSGLASKASTLRGVARHLGRIHADRGADIDRGRSGFNEMADQPELRLATAEILVLDEFEAEPDLRQIAASARRRNSLRRGTLGDPASRRRDDPSTSAGAATPSHTPPAASRENRRADRAARASLRPACRRSALRAR